MMKWREYAGIIHFRQIIHCRTFFWEDDKSPLWLPVSEVMRGRGWATGRMATELLRSRVALPMKDSRFCFFFQGKWCIQTKVDSPTSPIVINKCRGRWEAMIFRRVSSSHILLQWSFFPWSFSVPAHRTPRRAVAPRSEAWLRQVARQQKNIKKSRAAHSIHVNRLNNHEEPWTTNHSANWCKLQRSGKLESLLDRESRHSSRQLQGTFTSMAPHMRVSLRGCSETTGRPETRISSF